MPRKNSSAAIERLEAILRDLSERWVNRRLHKTAAEKKVQFYRSKGMEVPLVEIAEHLRQAGADGG